jgi:hypothetical protein
MWRTFLRWLAPLFIVALCGLPLAHAQRDDMRGGYNKIGPREVTAEDMANRTFALPYAVAALSMLIVLVIVCTPSRKMHRD